MTKITKLELYTILYGLGFKKRLELAKLCGVGIGAVNQWFRREEIPTYRLAYIKTHIGDTKVMPFVETANDVPGPNYCPNCGHCLKKTHE
jgi:hypothetical protein